ncbi:hypothetical protein BZL54_05895 [Burkholderia ubonensis subsp. mesacidophila]|uniref:Uncharacterized protein n=1 Tax=Burkholderia ubonensis subsp. mesacidophila TaxID=265293 RepID=A0A2A4FKZ1_9BURK|nr:hypothetical protein BZL54_05895 [Burkholderia ubonensis subsp. mesacidophila]
MKRCSPISLGATLYMPATLDERILALRIGANDPLGCLGLRRHPTFALYDTPMGYVTPMLCGVMDAQGFALTAAVFERIATPDLLEKKLAPDISPALVGKAVNHPAQIEPINYAFRVGANDLDCARLIEEGSVPAVFKFDGAMCEPATRYRWASNIVDRAKWYGVRSQGCGAGQCRTRAIACHVVVSSWFVRRTQFQHWVRRQPRLPDWHERCTISAASADADRIRLLAASCRAAHAAGGDRRRVGKMLDQATDRSFRSCSVPENQYADYLRGNLPARIHLACHAASRGLRTAGGNQCSQFHAVRRDGPRCAERPARSGCQQRQQPVLDGADAGDRSRHIGRWRLSA